MSSTAPSRRTLRLILTAAAALAVALSPLPLATAPSTASTPNAATSAATTTTAPARARSVVDVATDYTSLFVGQVPSLANAGWAVCPTPVTWSVDTGSLTADMAAREIANLQWALEQWTLASGLTFAFAGTTSLAYDDAAFTLAPSDGTAAPSRHVYLAFVADAASDRLGGGIVGLASPSMVFPTSKEIVSGAAVFRTDHVKAASEREARSLYIHELGHVLGLGHAAEAANIMYPVVSDHVELGAGDTTGVRSMMKPCAEAA